MSAKQRETMIRGSNHFETMVRGSSSLEKKLQLDELDQSGQLDQNVSLPDICEFICTKIYTTLAHANSHVYFSTTCTNCQH